MDEADVDDGGLEESQRPTYRRETPAVLASFKSLRRGRQELKCRCLKYSKTEPIIDIREYVKTDAFDGFTRKGVALNYEQILQLEEMIPEMKRALEEA